MNILWTSSTPVSGSGYGTQTKLWTPWLKRAGHNVSILATNGVKQSVQKSEDGILILPIFKDDAGNSMVDACYRQGNCDLALSLFDVWTLDPAAYNPLRWAAWTPIDASPLIPKNALNLQCANYIWSMSKFGEATMRAEGFRNIWYVPHGIDMQQQWTVRDRAAARAHFSAQLGVDLSGVMFIVSTAANVGQPARKGFYETLQAFKIFHDDHPDSLLYLHTDPKGLVYGENLIQMMHMIGLDPSTVHFPSQLQYLSGAFMPDYLRELYNAADVYLSTSHGEGFGLGALEAQACGCPVILANNSAQTELCLSGIAVECDRYYQPVYETTWMRPRVDDVVRALDVFYTVGRGEIGEQWRTKARQQVLEQYDAEVVWTKWMKPALDDIQADVDRDRRLSVPRLIRAEAHDDRPDVSVLMPARHAAGTIKRAIDSALDQKGVRVEVCVCVENDDDETLNAVWDYHKDPRVFVTFGRKEGVAQALNHAAEIADGRYMIRLDADDYYAPDCLKAMVDILDVTENSFTYGRVQYHGGGDMLFIPPPFDPDCFLRYNCSLYPVMWRRELWDRSLRFLSLEPIDGHFNDLEDRQWVLDLIFTAKQRGLPLDNLLVLHYTYSDEGMDGWRRAHSEQIEGQLKARWPQLISV